MTSRPPFNPTLILGCTTEQAIHLFHGRPVTPGEAEAIAQQSYPWRRHLHDPESYWITIGQAASILHTSPQQVKRLLDQHRLPHVRQASGVRLMRRAQIEYLASRHDPTANKVRG
jgi:hypothetical protein